MRYVMFLAMIACSGAEKPGEDAADAADADAGDADTDADADADTDSDADGDSSGDTETETGAPGGFPSGYIQSIAYWYQDFPLLDLTNLDQRVAGNSNAANNVFDPVAVGFEYTGAILSDGTLSGFRFADDPPDPTQEYLPFVLLTFASLEFFSATDAETQLQESCTALAFLPEPLPSPATPDIPISPFETGSGVVLSFDTNLIIDPTNTTCFDPPSATDGTLDPAAWGPGGTLDLMDAFDGAHFGIGIGPLTSYLSATFGTATTGDPAIMDSLFTEYIALNDATGLWTGVDWTVGSLFVWDESSHEVEITPDNLLVRQPIGF